MLEGLIISALLSIGFIFERLSHYNFIFNKDSLIYRCSAQVQGVRNIFALEIETYTSPLQPPSTAKILEKKVIN